MKVIIFGASGMVGQGILRECLQDPDITNVALVTRTSLGRAHPKIQEILHNDFSNFASIENQLKDLDACFYCVGITSVGTKETDYRRVTHDLTIAAAQTLSRLNPRLTFIFVSAAGADSTEKGWSMWARVKGQTENELLRMPFKSVHVFRPALIQPLHGIKSRTKIYSVIYGILGPLIPLLMRWFPRYVTTTEIIGRAMIKIAKQGTPLSILESKDINAV